MAGPTRVPARVYEHLRARILTGQYAPPDPLPEARRGRPRFPRGGCRTSWAPARADRPATAAGRGGLQHHQGRHRLAHTAADRPARARLAGASVSEVRRVHETVAEREDHRLDLGGHTRALQPLDRAGEDIQPPVELEVEAGGDRVGDGDLTPRVAGAAA